MHKVKCYYCGQYFDRDKVPCTQVTSNRYAHKDCSLSDDEKRKQELKDKEELEQYIIKLLKIDYVDARIQLQIKQYINDYNFTYSGIRKALIYFYEIKGNSIDKANGGIGIVPYVYKNAYNYYLALWQAQQRNDNKVIEEYVPVVKEIVIPRPTCKVKKRELFTFLDKENEENGI